MAQDKAWACVPKDEVLGRESARMRWRQNRSYVEVHLRLPRGCPPSTVRVTIRRTELSAYAGEAKLLAGTLHRPVKAEECVWLIQDGVLEITLLKESRKGCLADGETVASTFWRAGERLRLVQLLYLRGMAERLKKHPPPINSSPERLGRGRGDPRRACADGVLREPRGRARHGAPSAGEEQRPPHD